MAYFCVHAFDHPGRLEDRVRLRDQHRARLRRHDHPIIVCIGGPLTDDEGAMIGSMLVIQADDRLQVETFLSGDPYVQQGLYRRVDITRFNWGLGLPEQADG